MLNLQGVDIIHLWHKIHLSSRYIIGLATEQNTSQITLISILSSSLFLDIPSSNPAQSFIKIFSSQIIFSSAISQWRSPLINEFQYFDVNILISDNLLRCPSSQACRSAAAITKALQCSSRCHFLLVSILEMKIK